MYSYNFPFDKVLFRDYVMHKMIDLPPSYYEYMPKESIVYVTRFTDKEAFEYLRDKSQIAEEINKRIDVANHVADMMRGETRNVYFDFSFSMSFRQMFCFIKKREVKEKVKKTLIVSYFQAREKKVLKSYFKDVDWLELAKDEASAEEYDFKYTNDYYIYLATFNRMLLLDKYMTWMRKNNATVPIKDNDYSNPLNFVDYFMRQIGQYMDILRQDRGRRYYIVGDGPGTASAACQVLGIDYYSYEPNSIGDKAREIGLISSQYKGEPNECDIVFLANVDPYVDYNQYLDYDRVVVDYSGKGGDQLDRSRGGRGAVYATYDINLVSFPRRSTCLGILKDKEVNPQTDLAYQICVENGISVDKNSTYKVTTNEYQDEFNMITLEKPSDRRARKGHVKMFKGVFFYYFDDNQRVYYDDGMIRYHPLSYKGIAYTRDYHIDGNVVHVRSVRPEKLCGILLDDGRVERLFYISQYENENGQRHGIYKMISQMFKKGED